MPPRLREPGTRQPLKNPDVTGEQCRQAKITRCLICTDDERRQVLNKLTERRAVLLAQRAEIDEQLHDMAAVEAGHRAALAH